MIENWKPVPEFGKYYEVSNIGHVRPVTKRNLKLAPRYTKHGYVRAAMYVEGVQYSRFVHRLVAFAFIGDPPTPRHEVNHMDGDKSNNCVENLEWVTRQENGLHAYRRGLSVPRKGSQHGGAKLNEDQIREIRRLAGTATQREIADMYGVGQPQIFRILSGKRWGHIQ